MALVAPWMAGAETASATCVLPPYLPLPRLHSVRHPPCPGGSVHTALVCMLAMILPEPVAWTNMASCPRFCVLMARALNRVATHLGSLADTFIAFAMHIWGRAVSGPDDAPRRWGASQSVRASPWTAGVSDAGCAAPPTGLMSCPASSPSAQQQLQESRGAEVGRADGHSSFCE
jgi:hypothetical protein